MKWIDVKKMKPKYGDFCLCYSPDSGIGHFVGYLEEDNIWKCYIPTEERSIDIEWVTHWMDLPPNVDDPFHHQPERSKREDCKCPILKRYTMSGIYQGEYFKCRCGALNTTETP